MWKIFDIRSSKHLQTVHKWSASQFHSKFTKKLWQSHDSLHSRTGASDGNISPEDLQLLVPSVSHFSRQWTQGEQPLSKQTFLCLWVWCLCGSLVGCSAKAQDSPNVRSSYQRWVIPRAELEVMLLNSQFPLRLNQPCHAMCDWKAGFAMISR